MRGARVASESRERGPSGGEPSRVRRTMVGLDAPGRADARKRTDARRGVRAKGEGTRAPLSFLFQFCSFAFEKIEMLLFADQIVPDRYS